MQDFRSLDTWRKSHALALKIYRVTASFPETERYGLAAQMRGASTSVPCNVAEGCGRGGKNELIRFLQIASGSASELDYQILLSRDLGYVSAGDYEELFRDVSDVKRLLTRFIQAIRKPSLDGKRITENG
jgi:four helix bundle protein